MDKVEGVIHMIHVRSLPEGGPSEEGVFWTYDLAGMVQDAN